MKYQVFNRQAGELTQIEEFVTMLQGALKTCKKELKGLVKEDAKRYKTARQYEDDYGCEDVLTKSAWTSWGNVYDDRKAVEARIDEIEDAIRFTERLRKGSY